MILARFGDAMLACFWSAVISNLIVAGHVLAAFFVLMFIEICLQLAKHGGNMPR